MICYIKLIKLIFSFQTVYKIINFSTKCKKMNKFMEITKSRDVDESRKVIEEKMSDCVLV